MRRQKDFDQARLIGMVSALDIVKTHGVEALEKDIEARKRTGINPPMYYFDLDKCVDEIRQWSLKRAVVLFIAALHDEFGFGLGRLRRVMDKVAEGCALIQTGEATWWDYAREIDEQLGVQIKEVEGVVRIEGQFPADKRGGLDEDQA